MARDLVLLTLFSTLYVASTGIDVFLRSEYGTAVNLPCLACPIRAEDTFALQWYKSNDSDDFIKTGKALAWWNNGVTGSSQGFTLEGDFSMIITNVNLSSQGLYRCIVTPSEPDIPESMYDIKLDVYAKPSRPPLMSYIPQTTGFNVTCSVSHIFPKTFPNLTSYEGHVTAETNEDGTYNTAVSHLFPLSENTTIECLYSNLNFESVSSIRIVECPDLCGDVVQMATNGSNSDLNSRRSILLVSITMLSLSSLLIIIAYVNHLMKRDTTIFHLTVPTTRPRNPQFERQEMEEIDTDTGQPENQSGNENVKMQVNSKISDYICGDKFSIPTIITLIIQVTVVIILVAYVVTARKMK